MVQFNKENLAITVGVLCGSITESLRKKGLVSAEETFRFLGSFISQDLKQVELSKKSSQRMYFLHQHRKFNLSQELLLLLQFCNAIIQSLLCSFIAVWFGSATKQDRNCVKSTVGLQRKSLVPACPLFRTYKSLHIHHKVPTSSL